MLIVQLLCNVRTHGKTYKAGVQEIEKEIAQSLIQDGLARMALIDPGAPEAQEPEDQEPEDDSDSVADNKKQKKGGAKK